MACSFPTWQDCHEMWCKKRRRKADGKNPEESSKGARRESVPPVGLAANLDAIAASITQATEVQGAATSTIMRNSAPAPTETDSNMISAQYADLKQAESFYPSQDYNRMENRGISESSYELSKKDLTSYSRDQHDSKSGYGQGQVHSTQPIAGGHYQASNTEQTSYGQNYERKDSYSHEASVLDSSKASANYRDSSVYYEQLSPASDQPDQSYTENNYRRSYSYSENSNNSYSHSGARYGSDSLYQYKEQYSAKDHYNQSSQDAGFYKYAEQTDDFNKYASSEKRVVSPKQRTEASYGRW